MNIYTQGFWATCPENGRTVNYVLTIESTRTIMVEDIQEAVADIEGLHEEIADILAKRFRKTRQTLEAHHHGTHVKTIRGSLNVRRR